MLESAGVSLPAGCAGSFVEVDTPGMALPPVSIGGAVAQTPAVHTPKHAKLAGGLISSQINQSAISHNATPGADTVFAGTPSLLISLVGVDTLGAGSGSVQFLSTHPGTHHGGHGKGVAAAQDTPPTDLEISYAASGNLTLLGGGFAELTPASGVDSVASAAGMIPTVFGAATGTGSLAMDLTPGGSMHEAIASIAGTAPDLLLGWSFPQPSVTLNFATPAGPGNAGGAKLRDGTEVQIGSLPKHGVIDIIFNKSS